MIAALEHTSTASLAASLGSGEQVLAEYLDCLEERFERVEPSVEAFLPETGRFDRLRAQAAALLGAFPDPQNRPPLFGVPVGVKDIFHVDGLPTGGGSRLPPEELAGSEAASVTRLRQAGALILGKTVSTEFAYFAPGPTRNPWHRDHTPGGSSSGSAAAVGSELCPLALGTQTIGSIARPAAFCGVVGFKPSYDRISRSGVIPLSPSLDHVGPLAVDVSGAQLAAAALVADWRPTPASSSPRLAIPGPSRSLSKNRLGEYLSQTSDEGLERYRGVIEGFAENGFLVVARDAFGDFAAIVARHQRIVAAEAAEVHASWSERFAHLYDSRTLQLIEKGRTVGAEQLTQDLAERLALRERLSAQMESEGIDLWICPSAVGPAPHGLDSTGDPSLNLPWSQSGLPTLTLSCGLSEVGLPLGVQLVGRWGHDEELLSWGRQLESLLAEAFPLGSRPSFEDRGEE